MTCVLPSHIFNPEKYYMYQQYEPGFVNVELLQDKEHVREKKHTDYQKSQQEIEQRIEDFDPTKNNSQISELY